MIGFILYISTTIFFPSYLALLALPLVGLRLTFGDKRVLAAFSDPVIVLSFCFLILAAFTACILFILSVNVNIGDSRSTFSFYPYLLLLPISFLVAASINHIDFKVILLLFVFEALIGLAEYLIGVPTFFNIRNEALQGQTEFGAGDLLYYRRVFGLSDQSSVFALKALYVCAIMYAMRDNLAKNRWLLIVIFSSVLITLVITFNRTVLVSILFFLFVVASWRLRITLALFGLVTMATFIDVVILQFFRGRSGIDGSNRMRVFSEYWNFILEYPVVGNSGVKLWLQIPGYHVAHAHNSFIELLASNGIVVTFFVILSLASLAVKKGARPLLMLFIIYSTFQYGIFWGLSFSDILFFGVLMAVIRNPYLKNKDKWN